MNLSRNGLENLDPAWSPDGTRIAFVRRRPGDRRAHLFVMDADGRSVRRLTSGPLADRQPSWSRDGSRIAFVRSSAPMGTSRIFSIRADGTNLRRLTATGAGVVNTSPSWSPDGTRLVFSSDRGGSPQLYTMDADGGGPSRLLISGAMDVNPSWNPDGAAIAFERCCPGGASEVLVVSPDGEGRTNLTRSEAHEAEPAWSPDGSRVAFVRVPAGGGERSLWTMDAEGNDARPVTSGARGGLSPSWGVAAPLEPPIPVPEGEGDDRGATALGPAAASTAAAGPGRISQRSRRIAPGVRLIRRVHRRGPKRIFALEIDLRKRPTVDVGLAANQLLGTERTRAIAGRHRALAAVNGDFALAGGRPAHAFAEDGDLKQSSFHSGPSFAVVREGRRSFVRAPATELSVREVSGERWHVGRWNGGRPVHGEAGVFSPAGAGLEAPPRASCAARLVPDGPRRWGPRKRSVERSYVVRRVGCFHAPLARNGNTVIAARAGSPEALLIRSLRPRSHVSLGWSLGFPRVMDSIGGYPALLRDGRVVVRACSESLCARHPRTAVGVKRDGRILLVVVDGRRRRWSVGMTLVELARELRRMGARRAMNLDGGGSSTMVLRGRVVNRPSDGSERRVSSAVLVLRGRDRGEPAPGAPEPAPETTTFSSQPWVLDPGSSGGFLEAVAEGSFGPPERLSPELREALRSFRAG